MSETHMEQAGVDPARRSRILDRAFAAERFVAETFGGLLREQGDPEGDVLLPSGEIVDVKTVSGRGFVNGGAHRPVSRCVVVEWIASPEIVGLVDPNQWVFSAPPIPGGRACWWVARSAVRAFDFQDGLPARGTDGPVDSLDDASDEPPRELTTQEYRRRRNRVDDYRRRMRNRFGVPEPLPWTDPDTAHRGLGSGGGGRPPRRTHEIVDDE